MKPLMRHERTPSDGLPYYCRACGAGFGEFMACELPDCKLEDRADAQARQAREAKQQ